MASAELSKSRSLVILAVVVGCFAILWPNVFYPMIQNNNETPPRTGKDSPAGQSVCCGVVFESDASVTFLAEICSLVLKHDLAMELTTLPLEHGGRLPDSVVALCREELWKKCAIDLDQIVKSDVDGVVDRKRKIKGLKKQNLTQCLKLHFDIDEDALVAKKSHLKPVVLYPRHMRPERHPPHLHPENMHPALREKGRVLPVRTIEKQAKPGPMPGMRPPMGGAGHVVAAPTGAGVGILMPIYTIGIVIFFLYTMMRIMFKKPEDNEPHTKDFLLDAEQRKFIFAEDYCSTLSGLIPDITAKDCALIQERLEQKRRSRSKTPEVYNKEDLEPIPENAVTEEAVEEDIVEKTTAQPDTLEVPETLETPDISQAAPMEDDEVDQLRRRLEETERAMERIVAQMGNVSEKLMPIISTDASAHPDKEPDETPVNQPESHPLSSAEEEASSVQPQMLEDTPLVEETPAEESAETPAEEPVEEVVHVESSIEPYSAEEIEQMLEEDVTPQTCQVESVANIADETIADDHHHSTEDCPIDDLCLELREAVKSIGKISGEQVDAAPASGRQSSEERKLTVVGMDVMAAMEDGRKMAADLLPRLDKAPKTENVDAAVQEAIPSVFLDTSIPPESHLVVSEAECRAEAVPVEQLDLDAAEYESSPVVLSGKMTLSVIGLDNPPEEGSASNSKIPEEESGESGPRVHFAPQLTDHIFLIPVSEQEELQPEESVLPAEEEEEEAVSGRRGSLPDYRPPTPPLPHTADSPGVEEDEFLTYDQLEEAGEIDVDETIRAEMKEEYQQPEILLDIEYHLIPSDSNTSLDTTASQTSMDEFRPDDTIEQVAVAESVPEATEQQPTISCFTIREDFDEEDDAESQITEEEIQQARKEIEEIKKLLAGVSHDVINQPDLVSAPLPLDASAVSDDLVVQLANVRHTPACSMEFYSIGVNPT